MWVVSRLEGVADTTTARVTTIGLGTGGSGSIAAGTIITTIDTTVAAVEKLVGVHQVAVVGGQVAVVGGQVAVAEGDPRPKNEIHPSS